LKGGTLMAGVGPADGGATGTVRNPDLYCTAANDSNDDGKCHNYRVRVPGDGPDLAVCRFHGGGNAQSKAVIARGTIAELAEKQGIVLPDVKPKDFQRIAAEVISWNLAQFAALGVELESLRLLHSPISHAREYGDIFGLIDQMGRTIAILTKAAAALPTPPEAPPEVPAAERIREALEGVRMRMGPAAVQHCPGCTCGTTTPEDDPDDSGPLAPVAVLGRIVDSSQGPQA
jgi:hypothetical protein